MFMQKPMLHDSSFACSKCGVLLRLAAYFPQGYYLDVETRCASCNEKFVFWNVALNMLKQQSVLFRNWGAAFIGARQLHFEIQLDPDGTREVKFSDYGIPEDAKILYLSYTPTGGVFPIELHGNQPIRWKTPATISLYGRPIPREEGEERTGKISIFVTFLSHSPHEHALSNLALAFDAFLRDDYEAMIIPASVSVEDTMTQLADDFLIANKLPILRPSKQVIREIILPLACSLKSAPRQRTHILALIKELWACRDEMAHKGHLDKPLDLEKAAELLCAAIFDVNYFNFIRPQLCEKI
ncbi:MAG: hypothetical protein AB1540_18125 [Bdellovibrionota bacterium]